MKKQLNENIYSVSEFANKVGYHYKTLQVLDKKGIFPAKRNQRNRRYYTDEDYYLFLNQVAKIPVEENNNNVHQKRLIVTYSRVSSHGQRDDLKSQQSFIENFVASNGLQVDENLSDIGSGLNYERKNFLKILELVEQGKIEKIIIAHKDRFVRFGFDYFQNFCKKHNTEIVIINLDSCSPEQEFTEDLISIIHCFSSKLYGLRKYNKNTKVLKINLGI
jgi:ISSoc2, resolvase